MYTNAYDDLADLLVWELIKKLQKFKYILGTSISVIKKNICFRSAVGWMFFFSKVNPVDALTIFFLVWGLVVYD